MTQYHLELSPQAESDIETILQYTRQKHGVEQEDSYFEALKAALHTIRDNPHLGHKREDLDPKDRAYKVKKHVIVYAVGTELVSVYRILHGRMQFKQQRIS